MKFRNISSIQAATLSRLAHEPLRPGQILRGNVLKLYPNNKAMINLGGNRMIANLEVGLELEGRYYFQVTSAGNVIELKVLGERLKKEETINLSRLLTELGVKDNRHHIALLRQLTRNSIPFDKTEIQQAAQFLKGERNKKLVTKVLVDMIAMKLPMTPQTFKSLLTSRESTLSDQLKTVIQQLSSVLPPSTSETNGNQLTQVEDQLRKSISKIIDIPLTFREGLVKEITSQNAVNNQNLFHAFKSLGLLSQDMIFTSWVKEWNQLKLSTQAGSTLPFDLNVEEIHRILNRIKWNGPEFMQEVQKLITRWNSNFQVQELSGQALSKEALVGLRKDIKATLSPYLEQGQMNRLAQNSNNLEHTRAWYLGIQKLGESDLLSRLIHLTDYDINQKSFLTLTPQKQFLEQLSQTMTLLGMDYEHRFANSKDPEQVLQSIKGLLLQLGANQEASGEQVKLLQHIQGLQLQSMNETQTLLQANLQIPAEKLGLLKDLELTFEGKKNKQGKIDTDHCRILFYLELNRLGETVIDVNIQNRAISLTVFNNTEGLSLLTKGLKNKLNKNLDSLNYQLSALTFKKIEEKRIPPKWTENKQMERSQGVDFRI